MRLKQWIVMVGLAGTLALTATSGLSVAAAPQEGANPAAQAVFGGMDKTVAIVFAVALVVGVSCIAAGYAVGRVGSAALGAASERPELLGRSLILVGLAEGIAIYGLIIGIMILGKV